MTNDQIGQLLTQYGIVTQDMRLYAQQRFWVMTAYLITSGLLLNIAEKLSSLQLSLLAGLALVLTYCCRSWEYKTTQWWGRLIRRAQCIERKLGAMKSKGRLLDELEQHNGAALPVYLDYPKPYDDPSVNPANYTNKLQDQYLRLNAYIDNHCIKPTLAASSVYLAFFVAWSMVLVFSVGTFICNLAA